MVNIVKFFLLWAVSLWLLIVLVSFTMYVLTGDDDNIIVVKHMFFLSTTERTKFYKALQSK